jgi:preprotein translocase subunit YajC
MIVPVAASLLALQAPTNQIASMVFMYGAIFAIFYFVLIRPQQKQRKAQDELVKALKKGDEIVTAGGIVGEVMHIASTGGASAAASLEDRITIKSGDSRLIVERGRIVRVITAPAASA